jgi:diguanylate cyclase (GGDEF)-like protein
MPPAHDDMLTGLPNRRGFDEALGLEYRCAARLGTPLALVMIEVDGFRAYIEAHGRPAGEACLRAIARVTDRQLRHSRDRAARYGTETFAAILPATDEGHAVIVAEAIRRSVEQEGLVHCGSPTTIATVSIGVAALVAGGDDGGPAGLVERADAALHEARRCGCNMVRAASLLAR